jgi:hypothetical protein
VAVLGTIDRLMSSPYASAFESTRWARGLAAINAIKLVGRLCPEVPKPVPRCTESSWDYWEHPTAETARRVCNGWLKKEKPLDSHDISIVLERWISSSIYGDYDVFGKEILTFSESTETWAERAQTDFSHFHL